MKKIIAVLGFLLIVTYLYWQFYSNSVESGQRGEERTAGVAYGDSVPDVKIIARRDADLAVTLEENKSKQVLFGDLHVHSTYSTDAFLWALPLNHGKGVHPVADACDYARYCSAIDFWSITDHAEASTPLRWQRTKQALRQCQAKSADQSNPDLVSMLGFEWTQVGTLPSQHFGHKNVIFMGLDDDEVSARPIAAQGIATNALRTNTPSFPAKLALADFKNREIIYDLNTFFKNIAVTPECDPDLPSSQLPADCFESAKYPEDLIARLEDQGLDPLIIPHGSSWGYYTPPGTTWDKQLKARHLSEKFSLIEVYSGHGNSEEFRDYQNIEEVIPDTQAKCVDKQDGYTPPCVRTGEIIKQRCLAEGLGETECEAKAETAREAAANMGVAHHLAVASEDPSEWLESGQCTDCYLPSFNHRPGTSVQYGLAISNFDDSDKDPTRFNWGFIASSDNHRARAGTGYKEVARRLNTEAGGVVDPKFRPIFLPDEPEATSTVYSKTREELMQIAGFQLTEIERQSSFWQTGGLAGVHTEGRSREEIWDALQRRETYATSGPRMLLWFDHVDADSEKTPMGSTLETSVAGTFKVHAVGSFKQKPGCPEYAIDALGEERIANLCANECYNPSEDRNLIERIEIIRIRPQVNADEKVVNLIDDPFLVHECPADQSGCSFEFTDPGFSENARDALYYARAIQEPRPTINGDPIKCERDENGNCISATICRGDYNTPLDEDCLSMKDVRAWSSPIYLNFTSSSVTNQQVMETSASNE
ncbi:MAG: DUF3604 domain-containing protein [Gammaproteobacteria bacterium]|nr:DUF3604 domain-containing protein [Gammaproteobacteria bacterium]NNC96470.1 DUF3604 domain-containing protein [Gammaproteobacteria bacterium]NNM14985.1 DUF3604 domain-containing protein [Gammaproteobacteria bacterium]